MTLVRRGHCTVELARAFLAADEEHDPFAFEQMEEVVASLRGAIEAGRRITVHGDYDVDGVCATAIMIGTLRRLGANCDWWIPDRLGDGYGLTAPTVERLATRGTELLLTVDCGIGSVAEVAAAHAAGIEVIVTDHHQPGEAASGLPGSAPRHFRLPVRRALRHRRRLQARGRARRSREGGSRPRPGRPRDGRRPRAPAWGESRPRPSRPGRGPPRPAPRPAGSARVGEGRAREARRGRLRLPARAEDQRRRAPLPRRRRRRADAHRRSPPGRAEIAAELGRANRERREIELEVLRGAERALADLPPEAGDAAGLVIAGEGWHPGVVGIVASRLAEQVWRPVVLIALDRDGAGRGSGRSVPGFDLLAALHRCAPHLTRYGGHRAAAGVELAAGELEAFREGFRHRVRRVRAAGRPRAQRLGRRDRRCRGSRT